MNFKTEWDLQKYFYQDLSDPQLEKDIKEGIKKIRNFFDKYRSKGISRLNDKEFLNFLKEEDEDNKLLKAVYYLGYRGALDTQDQAVIKKHAEVGGLFALLSEEGLFFDDEFKNIGVKTLLRRSELPEYSEFKNFLESKADSLKYNLEEETEKALIITGQGSPTSLINIYDELTNSFVFKIELDDQEQELTEVEVHSLRESPDTIVTYSRVSSHEQKQKGDLDRQSQRLSEYCAKKKYPVEHIIKDVGSGLSDTRHGFVKLMNLVIEKQISKVVIEHKDRLTRFQYNLIEKFFNSYGVEIENVVSDEDISEEEELVNDIMMLMASFSGKLYGKRSAKRRKQKKENGDK